MSVLVKKKRKKRKEIMMLRIAGKVIRKCNGLIINLKKEVFKEIGYKIYMHEFSWFFKFLLKITLADSIIRICCLIRSIDGKMKRQAWDKN